jgi:hypothetical protein
LRTEARMSRSPSLSTSATASASIGIDRLDHPHRGACPARIR